MDRKLISNLLGISEKSFYRWKENRAIFKLLETYFSDDDIKEFLNTNKIEKFEEIKNLILIHKEAINIYTTYCNKLNLKSLNLFLSIVKKSNEEEKDLSNYFIDYILAIDSADNEHKKYLLQNLQNISNQTLFFYAIKQLTKNQFSEVYTYLNNDRKENLELKIKHLQAYLSIFLNKNYDSYNFYVHGIDEETEHLNIDNLIKQKSVFFDYEEDYLGHYYNYLFNLTFSKEDYIYKSIKIISN